MPVQYQPIVTVKPEEARRTAAIPEMHLEVPHIEFTKAISKAIEARGEATIQYGHSMATVAASMATLGKAVSGAGDEMWTRAVALAQLENEKKANDAIIGYEQGQTERNEKFKSLQGEAAGPGALKAFLTESENARQAIKGTLSPEGQKMYDQHTTYAYIRDSRMAASHASDQTKAATAGSYEARAKMTMSGMANSIEDKDFERGKADLAGVSKDLQGLHGWSEEQRAQWYKQNLGHAIASRATILAESQPNAAMKMLQENKEGMEPGVYTQAYNSIKGQVDRSGSRKIGDDVQNEMPNASLEDKRKRGAEMAEKYRPGDIDLKDLTDSKVIANHNKQKQTEKDTYDRNTNTVWDAVNGPKNPKSYEEAAVDPAFKAAFGSLDKEDRKKVIMGLDNNANPEFTGPVAEAKFQEMDGLLRNPNTKAETTAAIAANPDLLNRLETTRLHRTELYHLWRQNQYSSKKSEGELRIDHGENVLKNRGWRNILSPQQMPKNDRARFDSVFGSMAERMQADQKGKALTDDQWIAIGNYAMEKTQTPGAFFGLFGPGTTARYKAYKPDQTFRDTYKLINENASEPEIQRAYNAERFDKELKDLQKRGAK